MVVNFVLTVSDVELVMKGTEFFSTMALEIDRYKREFTYCTCTTVCCYALPDK